MIKSQTLVFKSSSISKQNRKRYRKQETKQMTAVKVNRKKIELVSGTISTSLSKNKKKITLHGLQTVKR